MIKSIKQVSAKDCYGCGICMKVCPNKAISMIENNMGFECPSIRVDLCNNCGKCLKICPRKKNYYLEPIKCFSFTSNEFLQQKSSSGGAFSCIAQFFLENKGYVVGAAFNNDFSVSHTIINDINKLDSLRRAKYIQSNVYNILPDIKKLLDSNSNVLFVGTPCQVIALKNFLATDYDNLYTVDLICNGVPSYKQFVYYLKDKNINIKNIISINFRDKKYGWGYKFNLKIECIDKIFQEDFFSSCYMQAFNQGLSIRDSCCKCPFSQNKRVGDFTFGDFWGIETFDRKSYDSKGVSFVSVNSLKAFNKYLYIFNNNCINEYEYKHITKYNDRLCFSPEPHASREFFFRNIDTLPYSVNVNESLNEKFDVAIFNFWWGNNYGACLTAFAIQQALLELGYSSRLIKYLGFDNEGSYNNGISDKFARKFLKISKNYSSIEELRELNDYANNFLVGSDQVFRPEYASESFFLDFVNVYKRKIAFSASFGTKNFSCSADLFNMYKFLFSRFDAISCRESSGIEILKDTFNIQIPLNYAIDPVFYLKRNDYESLIDSSSLTITNKNYILVYVLDFSNEISNLIEKVSTKYNHCKIVFVDNKKHLVEDWLKLLSNAKYIITDSFHGVCFSLIFKKEFICVINHNRGNERFYDLIDKLKLPNNIFLNSIEAEKFINFDFTIDYDMIDKIIAILVEKAINLLDNSLKCEVNKKGISQQNDVDEIMKYPLSINQSTIIKNNILTVIKCLQKNKAQYFSIYGSGEICDKFLDVLEEQSIPLNIKNIYSTYNVDDWDKCKRGIPVVTFSKDIVNSNEVIFIASVKYSKDIISYINSLVDCSLLNVQLLTIF